MKIRADLVLMSKKIVAIVQQVYANLQQKLIMTNAVSPEIMQRNFSQFPVCDLTRVASPGKMVTGDFSVRLPDLMNSSSDL